MGWFAENSGRETNPVGLKYPNQLRIHDMSGNVWEWCEDWYGSDYYEQCNKMGIVENPRGPERGADRVFRGCGWGYAALYCRVAFRDYNTPGSRAPFLGFRLALSLQ